MDASSYTVWRTGRLRCAALATVPRTQDGWAQAWSLLDGVDPTAADVPPPGRAFRPARLTPAAAIVVVALVVALAAIPVLITTTNRGTSNQGARGWVYRDSSTALFLSWTRSASTVSGSLSATQLPDPAANQASTTNAAFTGTVSGSSVTLTFPQGFGTVSSLSGQLSGSALVLSIPQVDGSLQPVTLNPGSAADYNAGVAALQASAGANQQASASASAQAAQVSAAAQAQASQSAATAAAQGAVDAAARSLTGALDTLNQQIQAINTDVTAVTASGGPLDQEAQLLTQTRTDAAKVEAEAKNAAPGDAGVCSDATGVASDATGVDSDNTGVQSTLIPLSNDQDSVQSDADAVTSAQQDLAAKEAAAPGYTANPAAPAAVIVSRALAAAKTATALAAHAVAVDTAKGNALAQAAHQTADAATKAGGC
ncbi:MAG: hypothetical protein ACR2N4_16675 [Jatrophihabitans sp.]